MTTLAVLVIALVLAPGLQSAVVEQQVGEQVQHLPGKIELSPKIKPLPLPPPTVEEESVTVPELRPLPIPEDPCAACFSYMSSLIDQLTDSVAEPSLPGIETLPLPVEPEVEIQPHPLPVAPEFEVLPHPVEPEPQPLPDAPVFVVHPAPVAAV